jgi:hypothetical protein
MVWTDNQMKPRLLMSYFTNYNISGKIENFTKYKNLEGIQSSMASQEFENPSR